MSDNLENIDPVVDTTTTEPVVAEEPVVDSTNILTPAEISSQKCTLVNNIQMIPTELNENEFHIEPIVFENFVPMEQLPNSNNIDGIICNYSVFENPAMNLLSRPFHTTEYLNAELEYSERTKKLVNTFLTSLHEKKNKINIVEIGVCSEKNEYTISNSSTGNLVSNKRPQDVYVGIDIIRRYSWNDNENNVHTIYSASDFVDENISILNSIGVNDIDLLVIDGWRSIEQLYKEWQYTKILSNVGIVLFNCVNLYPGPYYITKSIDDTKYDIYRYLSDVKDNGICVAVRK